MNPLTHPETGTAINAPEHPPLARIEREITEKLVAVLTFNHPDSSANVFDRETLTELDAHLQWVEQSPQIQGLILTSAKPAIFVAGADIQSLYDLPTGELRKFIEFGQSVFNRIEHLKIPTVAAIHGAALGGGLEVALACDWRVASLDRATSIGLPEIQLGILPAWGGSTRLPKLIGLPGALELILPSKTLTARQALKRGVVDATAQREYLLAEARNLLKRGKRKATHHPLTNNGAAANAISRITRGRLIKETRGNYPAPLLALDVICQAVTSTREESLKHEVEAAVTLAQTEAAKNLIRTFLLTQRARKLTYDTSGVKPAPIEKVAVIGAGIMGSGITQWVSSRGTPVIMQDIDAARVAAGMKSISKLYDGGVKRGVFTAVEATSRKDLIAPAAGPVPLKQVDLVIEAAVENLEIKKKIFRDLARRVPADAILATNTSALPIADLAADQDVTNPERVLGLHFFNPVHQMKLVEVVVAPRTSPQAVERALRWVKGIGKMPVVVKDSPGFLVNRILIPYLILAGHLFEEGVDPVTLDQAMLDFGMPMGPLRLLDEIGLDVGLHVCATMESALGERVRLPKILNRMVEGGDLGRKSGAGFFLYPASKSGKKPTGDPAVNPKSLARRQGPIGLTLSGGVIADLLALTMVNEAAFCLEEEVVTDPADVDFAMIMGTGWAPFRGGPLRYADHLGLAAVIKRYRHAQEHSGAVTEISERLTSMAREGRTFYS